jgi:multidrug efflux system outer membrane protein
MRKFLPLAVALALAGCSFTPEYQRPAAPVPSDSWPINRRGRYGATAITADWRSTSSLIPACRN